MMDARTFQMEINRRVFETRVRKQGLVPFSKDLMPRTLSLAAFPLFKSSSLSQYRWNVSKVQSATAAVVVGTNREPWCHFKVPKPVSHEVDIFGSWNLSRPHFAMGAFYAVGWLYFCASSSLSFSSLF